MGKVYQNIKFLDFDKQTSTVKIRNDFSFTNLDKYDFYYIIRDHGKEVYRGKIENIHAAPGKTVTTGFLNGIPKEKQTTGDVRIEFYAAIKTAEPFLPAARSLHANRLRPIPSTRKRLRHRSPPLLRKKEIWWRSSVPTSKPPSTSKAAYSPPICTRSTSTY